MIKPLIFICLGASFGASSRYIVSKFLVEYPTYFVTFCVNCTGSFLMGLLMVLIQKKFDDGMAANLSLFLLVGFLGSFTTFSAFSRDLYFLLEKGFFNLLLVAIGQVGACVVLFWMGFKLAQQVVP